VRFKVLYEDRDVVVLRALDDGEIEEEIVKILSFKPMTLSELAEHFTNVCSVDRLKRILRRLVYAGLVSAVRVSLKCMYCAHIVMQ